MSSTCSKRRPEQIRRRAVIEIHWQSIMFVLRPGNMTNLASIDQLDVEAAAIEDFKGDQYNAGASMATVAIFCWSSHPQRCSFKRTVLVPNALR